MAKHILKNNLGYFSKMCEDDASKDFWLANGLASSEVISDADALSFARGIKDFTNGHAEAVSVNDLVEQGPEVRFDSNTRDFSKEEIETEINNLIVKIDKAINIYENPPAIWTTTKDNLAALDLSSLSFPINGITWVDCLEKNAIHIPSSMEF